MGHDGVPEETRENLHHLAVDDEWHDVGPMASHCIRVSCFLYPLLCLLLPSKSFFSRSALLAVHLFVLFDMVCVIGHGWLVVEGCL